MSDKKYYWVLFDIVKDLWNEQGRSSRDQFQAQEVTDIHPIQLQHKRNAKYNNERNCLAPKGWKARERYKLINWKELTKSEYDQFKDLV